MVTVEEIAAAMHRTGGTEMVLAAPDVAHELFRQAWESPLSSIRLSAPNPPETIILGRTIAIDEHLPAGVWRLCDADMTLLYDCREGTSPP